MQNPQTVTDNIDSASKLKIELECFEPCQQEEGYTRGVDGSQTRWGVVYLPRPSGSGMSGGWIHFAVDHVSALISVSPQQAQAAKTKDQALIALARHTHNYKEL